MPPSTPIVTWELNMPTEYPTIQIPTIVDPTHSGSESLRVGMDFRELVKPCDFQDGGKYRCEYYRCNAFIRH